MTLVLVAEASLLLAKVRGNPWAHDQSQPTSHHTSQITTSQCTHTSLCLMVEYPNCRKGSTSNTASNASNPNNHDGVCYQHSGRVMLNTAGNAGDSKKIDQHVECAWTVTWPTFWLRRSTIPNAQAAEPICQSATGVAVLKLVRAPTISFGVPVFEQWPLKRYIISLVVLSTDAHGFILVNQIRIENFCLSSRNNWAYSVDCYCSFVSISLLSIKSLNILFTHCYS